MAANIREAKPAFSRRAWQIFHVIAAVVIVMSTAASLSPPAIDPEWKTPSEAYDLALAGLNTVGKIVGAAHQRARRPGTTEAVYQLEQVVRYRFYHGYSRYGYNENWLAWRAAHGPSGS